MSKSEPVYFRVTSHGTLEPADPSQSRALRNRRYRIGDLLKANLTKPRNHKFNGLVHKLGDLVVENIDAFTGMDPHRAIKRLQWEADVACDEIRVSMQDAWRQFSAAILAIPGMHAIEPALKVVGSMLPDSAVLSIRQPRSLSFHTMDEAEFNAAARQICRFLAERYWPECTAAEIERMAGCMVEE